MHWYFQIGIITFLCALAWFWLRLFTSYQNKETDRLEFVIKLLISPPIYAMFYVLLWPATLIAELGIRVYSVFVYMRARKRARDFFEGKVSDAGRNKHTHDVARDR